MTKPKPKPARAVDAVRDALDREAAKRADLKPIEIVKLAISAYQAFAFNAAADAAPATNANAPGAALRGASLQGASGAASSGAIPQGASGTAFHDVVPQGASNAASCGAAPQGASGAASRGAAPQGASSPAVGSIAPAFESADRMGLRRGTQASVDRLLFNVNYWRAAYEDRIVAACPTPDDARDCLRAISAWNSHTMKLNIMPPEEVTATFERFCPPFAANNRRGGTHGAGHGKGPVRDFHTCAEAIIERGQGRAGKVDALSTTGQSSATLSPTPLSSAADTAPSESQRPTTQAALHPLAAVIADVEAEAAFYASFENRPALDAFYDLLPAWCLQDRIELVTGNWWNDIDVMQLLAHRLYGRFQQMGYAQALCTYFLDAMRESLDGYAREVSAAESPLRQTPVPQLVELVRAARATHPDSETDGYGSMLPTWLAPKEQLIWNTVVCAIYGPMHARPLLTDELGLLPVDGKPASTDVITDLAQRAFERYLSTRRASGIAPEFATFEAQPQGLRASGLERIESIPDKLKVLGYRIVPAASCYPEQRIERLRPSEVECLAFLEHRRWLEERTTAGWTFAPQKDVGRKQSPYLVDWDDLPDRAREWNRSAARDIPALLASAGLAISR